MTSHSRGNSLATGLDRRSVQLGKLFVTLDETRNEINGTVLPLLVHLGIGVDAPELTDALEAAERAILDFLNSHRLTAEKHDV